MIMENSTASAFSDDEIQNNMNNGSCMIDFPFAPALPSCSVFDLPPPPSPLSDPHNLNDASFAGYMDDFNFNTSNWFPCYNFETGTGTSESLPAGAATQTDLQLPPLPVLSPAMPSEALNSQATAVSGSSSNTLSSNEAGAVGNKLVAVSGNEDGVQSVEGKQAEAEVRDGNEDHRMEVVENRNDQNQTKKPVKPKRKYKPRQRPAKVTFKMETEVDHLDDGFRWRKYGQKPIKNSPFPRSYYRCTTAGCGVKKHIERYAPEPSMLLTSYEGSHNHLAPKVTRTARLEIMHDDAIAAGVQKIQHNQIKANGVGVAGNQFAMSQSQPQQFQNQNLNVILQKPALPSLSYNNDYNNSFNIASAMNVNSADNFPPLNVVNSPAAHNSPPMNVVNSSAARNSPHMNVVNFSAARNSPPMNVVNFSAARNSPPMNVVNFSAAHNSSPPLNVVNSSAAHNSPTLNVVKNADNFINSSTTFSEFLQNLGGCNFSTLTNYNLMSNDGLLQDMIMPREMRGASSEAGAGAGAGAGAVS